jgi:hypothetical protein
LIACSECLSIFLLLHLVGLERFQQNRRYRDRAVPALALRFFELDAAFAFFERPPDAESRIEVIRDLQSDFLAQCNLTDAAPEVGRAAASLSIVAAAGELASTWGITGWPAGEAN